MTKREFLNTIIAETTNAEIAEYAVTELQRLDARNAKRAEKPSKTAIANAPIIEAIRGILTSEPQTASVIATALGISVNKASALCRQIVASGDASVIDVKVKGKGTQKGYFVE